MFLESIKDILRPYYYRWYLIRKAERHHKHIIDEIKKKGYANVVFFAANYPMWRYQGVYELMSKDTRFRTSIILSPLKSFSNEQKKEDIQTLKRFFESKGIPYCDSTEWTENEFNIRESLKPDILFYTQPYGKIYGNQLDSIYYSDKLLCYISYGTGIALEPWSVNSLFQNIGWKIFYDTKAFKRAAEVLTYNRAKNVFVCGNPNADDFLKKQHSDVWKPQDTIKKRIIWAPHYTIEQSHLLHRGSFLWLCDFMLELAKNYSDRIQIAFKPHPRLRSVLYSYPGWGKERTDEYYEQWGTRLNCQFESSGYIDLFMTSDAMIHDSSSFMSEYLYANKPVMFTTQIIDDVRAPMKEFGLAALDAHYIGKTCEDVKCFVEKVVLGGNDTMSPKRKEFYDKYLLPPNGKTVGQNVYDEIVKSIWG